jgi:hypothetical protein
MTPHSISLRSTLILSSRLRKSLPTSLFSSALHTKNLYEFRFALMRAACPSHLILLDLFILIIFSAEYKLSLLIAQFPSLLLFHASWVQIFSTAPWYVFCQRPSFTPIQSYRQTRHTAKCKIIRNNARNVYSAIFTSENTYFGVESL